MIVVLEEEGKKKRERWTDEGETGWSDRLGK